MYFLKLVRFPNLLIVALTQYLLQYLFLVPEIKSAKLTPLLDPFHFSLLVLSTVLIAAGGYIINDLKDYKIDLINKPDKVIINRKISASFAKKLYFGITIFGFFIALYLAFHVKNIPLVLIYPIAVSLLYLYANSLKKSTLWGNLIVSFFCAFVAGIVLFAEEENAIDVNFRGGKGGSNLFEFFFYYLAFAFLSTLIREIIKDMEDLEGDRANGCKTLPIVAGIKITKAVIIALGITLLTLLNFWRMSSYPEYKILSNAFLFLGVVAPLVVALFFLIQAKTKNQFHKLSQTLKFIMLSGILYMVILTLE